MRIPKFCLPALAIVLVACAQPREQSAAPTPSQPVAAGHILVANQQAASASLIDVAAGTSIEIPVGTGPHETAISHDGRTGVVTIYGDRTPGNGLAIIDLATGTVTKTISLGQYTRPHGAAFLPGDAVIVATSESTRNVVFVNVASGDVTAVPTQARGSHMLALDAAATSLFTANIPDGSISVFDVPTRSFTAAYPVATMTEGVAVSPDGRYVWVGSNDSSTVTVFDMVAKQSVATITGIGTPYRIGVTPDYRLAILADPVGGYIHLADTRSYDVVGSIALGGGPQGIAVSPDSRVAFITLNGANAVAMVDLATQMEIRRFTVGAAPDGIAYTPR